jgi:hypothetical protein
MKLAIFRRPKAAVTWLCAPLPDPSHIAETCVEDARSQPQPQLAAQIVACRSDDAVTTTKPKPQLIAQDENASMNSLQHQNTVKPKRKRKPKTLVAASDDRRSIPVPTPPDVEPPVEEGCASSVRSDALRSSMMELHGSRPTSAPRR